MKKLLFLFLAGYSVTTVQSQEVSDALRLAQNNITGTARFQAMSGAFGALGGDFSSINVNPAGSAIFLNNQVGVTLSNFNIKNQSNYFGSKASANNTSFDLNQAGAFFVFNNYDSKSDWKKFVLAVNYENTANFNNSQFANGANPTNSIANYFLNYANPNANQGGIYLSTLKNNYYDELNFADQQAYLGYWGNIINPVAPNNSNNDTYISNVPSGGNYYQDNIVETTGYNGKLSFNLATQYKDKFYFGLNINSHFTDFRQSSSFYEESTNGQTNEIRSITFNNDLYTYGTGFSFQLGAIAKITPEFRVGLAYESPTWYNLNDELKQSLQTYKFGSGTPSIPDSNVTIIYNPYKLRTPGKWTGSLAYVFGKSGLISVDLGIKDYSKTSFSPNNEFREVNSGLKNTLDYATEFRIGAEKRIKQWSIRAGYRNEKSPYKDGNTIGDLNGFSGGFGYNFGRTKLDLAYAYSQRKSQQGFFSQGFTDAPTVKTQNNNITVSLLFDL